METLVNQRTFIWSSRKIARRVTRTIVPVTMYNILIHHHDLTLQEIAQNVVDSTCIEIMSLHHFGTHSAHVQMKEYLDRVYPTHSRQM